MAKLFPLRSEPTIGARDPRVIELEDEDADAVFSALSSETARQLFAHLQEEPSTPSDLAAVVDSSIQNVRYHLEKMESAGLVDIVDTWYSSRGNEMSVYAAADGPLIVTGDRSTAQRIKGAIGRLVGAVAILIGMSLALQYALVRWLEPESTAAPAPEETSREMTDAGDGVSIQSAPEETTGGGGSTAADAPDGAAETAEAIFSLLPPGVLFFLGGATVLILVSGYWYWRRSY
ncbi:MAG: helix-turn-helix domain-containing protein [Natrialbaceae archaeon]|nr:helix-turn-helix domain-containing protein [Natrialbaceae archaeon]